ncbi:MAG: VIT domain-containing protein, partial [Planctomycetota bacterium]
MRAKPIYLTVTAMVLAACTAAWGDGMIVPVRPDAPIRGHWSVKYHHVKITVRNQVASVHIDQAFENHAPRDMEVEYLFPIPPGAAIDSLTMVVDGKELPGKLMEAKEARRIYESIVRKKKDPALLEYMGYGLYRTRAFPLQKGKPANVVVTYTSVCRKDHDLVEVFYPLNTEKYSAKKIEDVKVDVDIKARADITAVYSPSHELEVKRKSPRRVLASYHVKDALPDTDFQVYYKAADEKIGATVLSHRRDEKKDGYFLVLVSPNPKTSAVHVASKDLVIVLDHSGSMAQHGKMDQAREALRQVLGSLGPEDRFNVVTFCDSVDTIFGKLTAAGKEQVAEAVDVLDRLHPTGG